MASARFFRTGYLPTYAAVVYLLTLIWAGAPGRRVDFGRAWATAAQLGIAEILLLALVVILLAVLLQPLQMSIVRVLEGGWPRWLGSGLARRAQLRRKRALEERVQRMLDTVAGRPSDSELIQRAGAASARLRTRFPLPEHLVRPTALGNALAAMEDTAGRAYGLDTVVIWPRLYPVLSLAVRAAVDDLRDGVDAAARMAATAALSAVATVALLAWHSGLWTLLALAPLAVALLAYVGAVHAAVAFGAAVQVAFDLNRFDLVRALRLALPADQAAEMKANRALSDFLRQGVPVPFSYVPDPPVDEKP